MQEIAQTSPAVAQTIRDAALLVTTDVATWIDANLPVLPVPAGVVDLYPVVGETLLLRRLRRRCVYSTGTWFTLVRGHG